MPRILKMPWDVILKAILDIEFFLVGYRLQKLPIVRKHALALQSPCNVFLDQIIYFLQPERPLRIRRYVNGQQAERKSSVAAMLMLFVCQQSEFCVLPS